MSTLSSPRYVRTRCAVAFRYSRTCCLPAAALFWVVYEPRHHPHSICGAGPCLGSDLQQAPNHLTERHIHHCLVIVYVSDREAGIGLAGVALNRSRTLQCIEFATFRRSPCLYESTINTHTPRKPTKLLVGKLSLSERITVSATSYDAAI